MENAIPLLQQAPRLEIVLIDPELFLLSWLRNCACLMRGLFNGRLSRRYQVATWQNFKQFCRNCIDASSGNHLESDMNNFAWVPTSVASIGFITWPNKINKTFFFSYFIQSRVLLSVAYLTVANLARLGILVQC